jgi:hypothetical protein
VNILDENIIASQCDQLRVWRIPFQQVGHDVGRQGMDDTEEIIPLLHRLIRPTFFTRDPDFYDRVLCHLGYSLVVLSVRKDEAAYYLRRFLRHPEFNTHAKRMGRVVRVNPAGIVYWTKDRVQEETAQWPHRRGR